ncbi:hypothetical protein SAMN05216207_11172 [Pseudonocardia ammonioxydans]|uniref:Uncharacterized protein n=1 Tax=Pseudonocardia ammonioxydans TaxID=260086 RepID=A0A1I5INV0_PSUAM|nr:hypothetical protein [Pseudonocardia ammonioxydans]SFO62298.1 hypothetical protein SAMN05216207_11172 [Pseudonocardia ammonioxydans]
MTKTVAVLGSGDLAAGTAAAILDTGHRLVRLWGVNPARSLITVAEDARATLAHDLQSALDQAWGVVVATQDFHEFSMITAATQCRAAGSADILLVRDMATVSTLPQKTDSPGTHWLEAVVLGSTMRIGYSTTIVLVRGDHREQTNWSTELSSLGSPIFYTEQLLDPETTDAALIGFWYDLNAAMMRALANVGPESRPVLEAILNNAAKRFLRLKRVADTAMPAAQDDCGAWSNLDLQAVESVIERRERLGASTADLTELTRLIRDRSSLLGRPIALDELIDDYRWTS